MNFLFGTDGIRGTANQYPMTAEMAFNLGRSIGYYIKDKKEKSVIIGKDTRVSGDMFEDALSAGLCSSGNNVMKVGISTTPAVAFLTRHYKVNIGVVISASHNPYQDNGIKLFQSNGFKFENNQEHRIEDILIKEKYKKLNIPGRSIGIVKNIKDANEIYIKYILKTVENQFRNKINYKIVLDCANGAAGQIIERLFNHLHLDYKIINNEPNGFNINDNCGSTSMYKLQRTVIKENADIGFAYDGDADRVLAVDEKGNVIDGDQIMSIYASTFIRSGKLGNKKIITTFMSNLGFDEAIEEIGGKVIRTDIGDKFVLRKMLSENALMGGEQSGHIIFLRYSPNGDGIITTFQLLKALELNDEKVSIQASRMKKYHQRLLNYCIVEDKETFLRNREFIKISQEAKKRYDGLGRVLIRPSGTERKIRILLESKEKNIINEWEQRFNLFFNQVN